MPCVYLSCLTHNLHVYNNEAVTHSCVKAEHQKHSHIFLLMLCLCIMNTCFLSQIEKKTPLTTVLYTTDESNLFEAMIDRPNQ